MDWEKLKISKENQLAIVIFLIRINLAWTFLHAFIDKAFGISKGWQTAWINGGSPTTGYLSGAAPAFKWMAGSGIVDFLFMLGLLCLGVGLLVGAGRRLVTAGGVTLMMLMWFAKIPVPADGFTFAVFWKDALVYLMVDHHIVDSLVFLLLFYLTEQDKFSLNKWWTSLPFVENNKWLK